MATVPGRKDYMSQRGQYVSAMCYTVNKKMYVVIELKSNALSKRTVRINLTSDDDQPMSMFQCITEAISYIDTYNRRVYDMLVGITDEDKKTKATALVCVNESNELLTRLKEVNDQFVRIILK